MKKTLLLYLEILVVLGLPLVLMGTSPLALSARPILLAFGGIYCAMVLKYSGANFRDVGLTKNNFLPALKELLVPSLVTILSTIFLLGIVKSDTRLWLIGTDPLTLSSLTMRIIFYVFGSAPVQELMFRGYFTYRLMQVFRSKIWIITISTLVFIISHLPFKSPIMLFVALLMGISFILNYLKYKNLGALTLSHAIVGAVLIIVRNYYLPYS